MDKGEGHRELTGEAEDHCTRLSTQVLSGAETYIKVLPTRDRRQHRVEGGEGGGGTKLGWYRVA